MDTRIPILVPTFHKMEGLLTSSIQLLSHTWPNHGDIYVISDNKKKYSHLNFIAKSVYRLPHQFSWLRILHEGLLEFIENNPKITCVYFILDDLLPLIKVDGKRLKRIEEVFVSNHWKYLYFPHYENNYEYIINIDSESFTETPENYKYFSQIGAGIIEISHLLELCVLANQDNLNSPWQFEFLHPNATHYISSYRWPSIRDGFSKSKFINTEAIELLNYPEGVAFKKKLQKQYFNQFPRKFLSFINQKIENFRHKYLTDLDHL